MKNYTESIAKTLNLTQSQVQNILSLTDENNTVHFIARYRKEKTHNADENEIRAVIDLRFKMIALDEAKEKAIKNIKEQDKLTPELEKKINEAKTLSAVEDLYAPYKRKKKTKADIARELGFGPVADQIRKQIPLNILAALLAKHKEEDILSGACDIIAQDIADNTDYKELLRQYYLSKGSLSSNGVSYEKLDNNQIKQLKTFSIYEAFTSMVKRLKSYQILALNRGETLGLLKVSLDNEKEAYELLWKKIVTNDTHKALLTTAVKDGYKKLFSSIERELRSTLSEKASDEAIRTFQKNLKNLLLLKPHYGKGILAIDPGYRTGCKICVLDENGNPKKFSKVFIEKEDIAVSTLKLLESQYKIDIAVIGNGTASNETVDLLRKHFPEMQIAVVNESGASVYSVSEVGQEEFPDLDATDRGTVSIGRRYIDALSELVKIPVISIGVGMYQHDMNQKELEKKLSEVVEDVVNAVGINVNVASPYLLSYISGLTKKMSQKVYDNRPYDNRIALKKILSAKAFEQAAGFLRIPDSDNEFDKTSLHPEQYKLAEFIIKHRSETHIFQNHKEKILSLYADANEGTVQEIIKLYDAKDEEVRKLEGNLTSSKTITIEDIEVGQKIKGVVRNITQFGAFVDIGLKNDGLIHISQLADKFVSDPHDIVTVGEQLTVKVIGIDLESKKIQLSLKDL